MRKLVAVLVGIVMSVGAGGIASALTGPSGSQFSGGQVHCGHSQTFLDSPVVLYNGYRGLEVCSEAVGRAFLKSDWDKPTNGDINLPDFIHWDWDDDFIIHGSGYIELPF